MIDVRLQSAQLDQITSHLGKTDWWAIFAQIFAVGMAAFSAYLFQIKFDNKQKKILKREEAHDFNVAVSYTSVLKENLIVSLTQTIFPSLFEETDVIKNLTALYSAGSLKLSFKTIPKFEIASEENLISRIYEVGKYTDFVKAFWRLRSDTITFEYLAEERIFLIKKAIGRNESDLETIKSRVDEIHQRTKALILLAESILDALTQIGEIYLKKIGDDIIADLRAQGLSGIKISHLQKNDLHDQIRKELWEMHNADPKKADRFLYLPFKGALETE